MADKKQEVQISGNTDSVLEQVQSDAETNFKNVLAQNSEKEGK